MRVAVNGFGRIGRSVFRVLNNHKDIDVVAINDIFDKGALVYLLKYDTVMGRFPGNVSLEGDVLIAGHQRVKLLAERIPEQLPWGEILRRVKQFCLLLPFHRINEVISIRFTQPKD